MNRKREIQGILIENLDLQGSQEEGAGSGKSKLKCRSVTFLVFMLEKVSKPLILDKKFCMA